MSDWQPGADLACLQARAQLLAQLRRFFADRDVLEVETPLLCGSTVTDPYIQPIACQQRFLQTSPEYAMKRLLAAGCGSIFQICKAFRQGEAGTRHNPEFTLLEWYRSGYDQHQLMAEVQALVEQVLPGRACSRFSYQQLFQHFLGLDPFTATGQELERRLRAEVELDFTPDCRDTWLDLLLSHLIEPQLVALGLVFVYDYPQSQASLARLRQEQGMLVGERFELFVDGLELANGYCELTCPVQQAARFAADNALLLKQGQPPRKLDQHLLAALAHGLPDCAGVALGVDRLLMLQTGVDKLDKVLSFSWERA